MRLGIGSYTFAWAIGVAEHPPRQPMTASELLEEAARLGVRVVQFCDNLSLANLSESSLARFEKKFRELGLAIELGTRGLDVGNLRRHLELCQRFNCPFLRLVTDSEGDEPAPEEAVRRLQPLMPEFAVAGIRLAIENHDRFPSSVLAGMVEQLGTERAGICLDTVNSLGALESLQTVVEALARYTLCLHVKDFTIRRVSHNMGFVVEGRPAGQGKLNVPWLLGALRESPHPFNAILETWVTPGNSLDETIARERRWAEEGIAHLRRWVTQ